MKNPISPAEFLGAAHRCAMEMMRIALSIREELPGVALPPGLTERLHDACEALIETKFDIVSGFYALDERFCTTRAPPARSGGNLRQSRRPPFCGWAATGSKHLDKVP